MSKLSRSIALSQTMVSTAAEEALRCGHPAIDVDHLLLAVSTMDDPAGRLLRAEGADLTTLRHAAHQVHGSRVAALGLTPPELEASRVPNPASVHSDIAPRAMALMRRVSGYSSAFATLTALIDEPSGLAREVLSQAGVDPGELRVAIERAQDQAASADGAGASTFISADPRRVWEYVTDVGRRPEWDPAVGRVEAADGGEWDLWAPTHGPDGSEVKVKPRYRRRRLRELSSEPGHAVEWVLWWPDSARPQTEQRARLELTPEGEGTCVRLTYARRPAHGWARPLSPILGPLARLAAKQHARLQLAGISRALR